ncbi:KH domain-containing protein [Alkalicoccus daliensis]|uniref:RNA-binding protein KhpA n=1 Tax=Alkalicoccus daliensis TaxID=745820 RepID=A0A1H0A0C0_9BACI|nr:KH domain-containing protein [Alkalicoccus daliensis]SDN27179.1 RNA-binding protein (KH domain) [Alkalicoccus daliensis]
MKELVETIAKSLVDHPEDVRVTEVDNGHSLSLRLEVHADDMGKVIGKHGRIAKAFRSVVYAAGTNQQKRIQLDIG